MFFVAVRLLFFFLSTFGGDYKCGGQMWKDWEMSEIAVLM